VSVGHRNTLLKCGYLHRDVSLESILIDPSPSGGDKNLGRLIDFDLAKLVKFGARRVTFERQVSSFKVACLLIS